MKPFAAVRLGDSRRQHRDDDVVGDEPAGIHDRLDPRSERAARGDRGAQHVAGRELHETVFLFEPLRLGALAGARRPEKDQVHQRRPRSRAFLISPSYWCASRCEWICATVSIVTLTTIKRLVPPK